MLRNVRLMLPDDANTRIVLAIACTASAYIFYQTKIHPLSQYPGPLLAKLTRFQAAYHAIRGTRHLCLYEVHQTYGDIVRYGPNHISVNDSRAVSAMYGPKVNVRKSDWYTAFFGVSIFNARDIDVHARKRRVMSQAFSSQTVQEVQPAIMDVIRDWTDALGDASSQREDEAGQGDWSSPKDISDWSAYMIFDALGNLLYGKSFETITSGENRPFLQLMGKNIWYNNIIGQMPVLKRLNLAAIVMRDQMKKAATRVAFSWRLLRQRLSYGPEYDGPRDIIHHLQQARDPETGEGYDEPELISDINPLLGAGSDTTSGGLTALWYFLAHNPDVTSRLTASIRESFQTVEDISSAQALASNALLRACIGEALRLCPPVPMLLPREVCKGGLDILGHHLPQGTIVGVPTYTLHHNSRYFSSPFKYRPERWMAGTDSSGANASASKELTAQREAFIPFSTGPRACIGRTIAMLELQVSVARVLYLYDIRLELGSEAVGVGPMGEYKIRDYFIIGKEGPILQFRSMNK